MYMLVEAVESSCGCGYGVERMIVMQYEEVCL